jgi:hypothetical protein
MVLSLMACALVASLLSRLISPPLYASLAQSQVNRLNSAVRANGPEKASASGRS